MPLAGARLCAHGIGIDVLGRRIVRVDREQLAAILLREGSWFLGVRLLVPTRARGITFLPLEDQRFVTRARELGFDVRSSSGVDRAELAVLDPQDSFARWRYLRDLGFAWIVLAAIPAAYWAVGNLACAPDRGVTSGGHAGSTWALFGWMALVLEGGGLGMLAAACVLRSRRKRG
ncbi:MAG: hypothetical protein U1F29_09820 [Planctomycetota bacterium]